MNPLDGKRIALYIPHMEIGGVQQVVLRLIGGFLRLGVGVDLLLNHKRGDWLGLVPAQARVFELKPFGGMIRLGSLARYLRREKPQALLSLLEGPNFLSCVAKMLGLTPVKVVASVRNMDDQIIGKYPPGLKKLLFSFFYLRVLRSADRIIVASQGVKNSYLALKGKIPPEKITVIPNPVAVEEVRKAMEEPITEKWFDGGLEPFLLGAGRLEFQKDFETLLRAFALARRQWPCKLVILGTGGERPALEALILELGLQGEVVMPGNVGNPWKFMKRASAFVLSSRHEGFGNVLAEAMVCGIPIVSTDCPSGPSEILEAGKWGRLVPVGDPQAMAGAILDCVREGKKLDYERRLRDLDLDQACRRYLETLGVFRSALEADKPEREG